jgi:hypothetical protein
MAMGDQIAGMYPTLVIVVVNFQPPIWEEKRSGDGASITPLPWNVKRSGYTNTSGTHPEVGCHLDTVIDVTIENSIAYRNVKWPPFEDV